MFKILNVALTVFAFIQIFISDHSFDIKDDIEGYFDMPGMLQNYTSYPIKNKVYVDVSKVNTGTTSPTVTKCACR